MGVYLKNKPSYLNSIVSNGIIQWVLMLMLAALMMFSLLSGHQSSQNIQLVEFNSEVTSEELQSVLDRLKTSELVDRSSIIHHTKEAALQLMKDEMNGGVLEKLALTNPYRDIIEFSYLQDNAQTQSFGSYLAEDNAISGIYDSSTQSGTSNAMALSFGMLPKLLLGVLLLLISYFFFSSSIRALIEENKQIVRSLIIYGSDNSYITSLFSKFQVCSVIRGWILAFVLFIPVIYLLINLLGLRIADISVTNLILAVIFPLLLVILMNYIIVKIKLTKFLKSL